MELSHDLKDMRLNMYFKYQGEDEQLISGLPLPKNSKGYVGSILFIECTFHCNCVGVEFVNCCFYHCSLPVGFVGYNKMGKDRLLNCATIGCTIG